MSDVRYWLTPKGYAVLDSVERLLECDHKTLWPSQHHPPKIGSKVYCDKCENMRQVINQPGSWYASCTICRWRITRGTAQGIVRQVQGHVLTKEHPVKVADYDGKTYVVTSPDSPPDNLGLALFDVD